MALGDLKLQKTQLDTAISELELLGRDSEARKRAAIIATGKIRTLILEARFECMRPVARAAKIVFKHDKQLRDGLRIRPKLRRAEEVIEALRGMADVAAPYKAEIAKAGFTEDFIDHMLSVADSLKEAVDTRGREVALRSAASVGLVEVADRGAQIVLLLDDMLTPRLRAQPSLLGDWKSIIRQGKQRVSSEETSTEEPGGTGASGGSTPPAPPVTPVTPVTPASSGSGAGTQTPPSPPPLPAAA